MEDRSIRWDSYYDPNSGRFLTEDPHPGKMTSPISHINKYIYTSNNPINLVDPSGLFNIGRELGSFFGGSGGWTGDLITAAVVVGIIVVSGGTATGAVLAVMATAGGAALASGGMAAFQKGNFFENFSNNFHTNFRISATFLAIGAMAAPGGVAKAGANSWYQGSIESNGGSGGLTIGSSSVYTAGGGIEAHEAMHTIQWAIGMSTVSAVNRYGNMGLDSQQQLRQGWYLYGAMGIVGIPGLGNDGGVFPVP